MHFARLAPRRLTRFATAARRSGAAAIGAIALGASGAAALIAVLASGPANAAPRAASLPRCSSSGLVVWLDTQGNGAAGSVYYQLELTNLSGHSCTLHGYAGVSAVTLGGRQLGSPASRETGKSAATVTLPNRRSAIATLRIVQAGNFSRSTCRQAEAAGLRVYPPGERAAKLIPFPFEACSRSGPTYLSIGPARKAP